MKDLPAMEYLKKLFVVQCIVLIVTLHTVCSQVTGTDCNGKDYLCFDDRMFQICIDFGNGKMQTIDEETLPCPRETICSNTARSRCVLSELPLVAPEDPENETNATPESNPVSTDAPETPATSESSTDVKDTDSKKPGHEESTLYTSDTSETTSASEDKVNCEATESNCSNPKLEVEATSSTETVPQKSTASPKPESSSATCLKIYVVSLLWFMILCSHYISKRRV